MASVISVPFTVMEGGVTEAVSQDAGPTAQVKFKVAADDRYQFIRDMIGTATSSGGTINRVPPYAYPPAPYMHASAILSMEPHGKPLPSIFFPLDGRWIYRKYTLVTVQFSVLPFGVDGTDPYTVVTFGSGGEFQTMPFSTYRFADGTPTTSPAGKLIPSIDVNVTRYRMPSSPLAQVSSVLGKVNTAAYSIGGYSFAAGTLLFSGGDENVEIDTGGGVNRTVSYRFTFRPIPWNYCMSPVRTVGYALVTDGNGDPIYDDGNLAILP